MISPPLRGDHYISADSCCDATRHTRAALPVNGRVWVGQRYAVDWEQTDASGRIYAGPPEKLQSYAIFGQPVLAVANAVVVSVIDGLPEQTPGKYPTNIPLDQADGNSVILDLGEHRYAVYAHMQPGSIKVRGGEKVHPGQVIGLVGDTGNSIVPHLHFQVTAGPSSFSANGLPYEISAFQVTGNTGGTEAFDQAESNGTPLAITPINPPQDGQTGDASGSADCFVRGVLSQEAYGEDQEYSEITQRINRSSRLVQFFRQRSSSVLLQEIDQRDFDDAKKAKDKTGEEDSIEKSDVADSWKVAGDGELECDHRQQHGHGNLQKPIELFWIDPKNSRGNESHHHQRQEDLPDIKARSPGNGKLEERLVSLGQKGVAGQLVRRIG